MCMCIYIYIYIERERYARFRRTRAPRVCSRWPEKGRESGQRKAAQGAEGSTQAWA